MDTATATDLQHLDARYAGGEFRAPTGHGFVHLAAQVRAPSHPGPIFRTPRAHAALLDRLKGLARALGEAPGVESAAVYDAVLVGPPGEYDGDWGAEVRPPHFDVVVLVETSAAALDEVRRSDAFRALLDALGGAAKRTHVVACRDALRLADVRPGARGLFAFHYFAAADRAVLLDLWRHLARFHQLDTGLAGATLLVPETGEASDYLAIDHARWDVGVLRFLWRQATNRRAWTQLRRTLHANRVGAMPILYRAA